MLGELDVPYVAAHALEFQTLEQWEASERGLLAGRGHDDGRDSRTRRRHRADGVRRPLERSPDGTRDLAAASRARRRAGRARRADWCALRKTPRAERKLAIVLFNFPPNGGAAGTAAFLGVYASLLNTLRALRRDGYDVEVPADEDALRKRILDGNAARFGAAANVCARIPVDDHVRRERHLEGDRGAMGSGAGPASDATARSLFVSASGSAMCWSRCNPRSATRAIRCGLLFERGFAPTHAFSAFYRYLREDFAADAILHFGMHGALEFMPGKQVGHVGGVLAGAADRRDAEHLSLRRQQSRPKARSPSAARPRRWSAI